jgi:hypothetical protein
MEDFNFEEAVKQLQNNQEIFNDFIDDVKTSYKKHLKKKHSFDKKNVETLHISLESPQDLKEFIYSRKIMIKRGEFKGKNYNFTYADDFIYDYELRRRLEQKEKMRQDAKLKKEAKKLAELQSLLEEEQEKMSDVYSQDSE